MLMFINVVCVSVCVLTEPSVCICIVHTCTRYLCMCMMWYLHVLGLMSLPLSGIVEGIAFCPSVRLFVQTDLVTAIFHERLEQSR